MKVILGAGKSKLEGWISTQEDELNILLESDWLKAYKYESMDALLAEHVWEHLTLEEGIIAAKNCYKFLKPGGYLRCAVPDSNFDNEWYQNMVQVGGPGPIDHPASGHKIVYNYKQFVEVFKKAGFKVDLLEYCDENNKFHYTYWNEEDGKIGRSYRFDTRNTEKRLKMVSLIIDAKKEVII
jgi:predicted SAM-dependent methyltransferase